MRIVRFAALRATPWKNGGGATTEIAAFPEGAGLDDFEWRISVADIAAAGPFSRFDGVDRVLTVATGEALELTIDGRAVTLGATAAPFAFAGEADVFARLGAGPVRDINVMTRRGRWRASVSRLRGQAVETSVLIALGACEVEVAGRREPLAAFDALFPAPATRIPAANAVAVSFTRA